MYDRTLFASLLSSVGLDVSDCNMQSQQSHGFSYAHNSLVDDAIDSYAETCYGSLFQSAPQGIRMISKSANGIIAQSHRADIIPSP